MASVPTSSRLGQASNWAVRSWWATRSAVTDSRWSGLSDLPIDHEIDHGDDQPQDSYQSKRDQSSLLQKPIAFHFHFYIDVRVGLDQVIEIFHELGQQDIGLDEGEPVVCINCL